MTVCVVVIVMVIAAVFGVNAIRDIGNHNAKQTLLLLCQKGQKDLDYYFQNVESSVKTVAAFVQSDLDGVEDKDLQAHMDRVSDVFQKLAYNTNGVLTYYYRIDPEVSGNVKGFWYINTDGAGFREHEVTDITAYDTSDTSTLVWFTVPKATGEGVWLPPYITENLDVRVLSYNIPVTYRGQFVGVIGIEIDYSVMADQVESIRLYNNGYAFLTDAEGTLIFHPRIDIAQMSGEEKPTIPEGLLSESTFTSYTFDNTKKEAAWLRLSNGMRLYVSVPESETDGEWHLLIRNVLIAAAAVLFLSILLTQFITRRITKPLKQLTEAAQQADQGYYDVTLDYNGKDEIGTLTRTFRRMAGHMKDYVSDLNKRANVDSLTSVRNKGAFTSFVEEMQKKLDENPNDTEFAVGIFDCDDLKEINDRYGHDKGDLYLKTASRLICKVFQHSPVFRIGGDEFAAILRNEDLRHREELVESFNKAMDRISAAAENPWEQVHVSIGIAVFDPAQDDSITDLIRRADRVMYTNKRINKNTGAGDSAR